MRKKRLSRSLSLEEEIQLSQKKAKAKAVRVENFKYLVGLCGWMLILF